MNVFLFPPLCVLPDLRGLEFRSPMGKHALSFPGFPGHESKGANREKEENAKVFSRKFPGSFGFSENDKAGPPFSLQT